MVVKKYFGKTTRDALRQVREELGADALILSNRPTVGGGVEIMAVADADVAALATTLSTNSRHPARNTHGSALRAAPAAPAAGGNALNRAIARTYAMPVEGLSSPAQPQFQATKPAATPIVPNDPQPAERPPERSMLPFSDHLGSPAGTPRQPAANRREEPEAAPRPVIAPEPVPHAAAPAPEPAALRQDAASSEDIRQIGDEIKLLRSILQSQLATFAWNHLEDRSPNRAELFRSLLSSGLSSALIRQLIAKMPGQYEGEVASKWARSALTHNLKCAEADRELLDQGGIFALVGPTGVGKTTTVAKLAARAVMKFGPQHVALVTTDGYRIGAQDQLRIYGKILGVPVYAVQNEAELELTLADLAGRHIVFVDTVGMGQRDARVVQQAAMFAAAGRPVERILLLAANADGHTLEDVVRHYRGVGLAGCILSKIDESVSLGPALDAVIRNRLRLFYVTNGQRVPEDLHLASASYLIDRALKAPQLPASPFEMQANEMAIMNAAQAGWL
ncbi:flagellar biosynthesis protein FlhF [Crenobacter cavernae]|uniref:Flagellar biosynthesis protein FlhF n=1 Tax=Crenobacter cavernae TaxID=2290923 RepID=A0A345Y2J6_9NEIS|nr:flagellar biosynthesis protein FlhF [Crenobacter cavernae]AXK38148.1 flagellar biosynthesis protein FlhF [Crenobacter cavernae]